MSSAGGGGDRGLCLLLWWGSTTANLAFPVRRIVCQTGEAQEAFSDVVTVNVSREGKSRERYSYVVSRCFSGDSHTDVPCSPHAPSRLERGAAPEHVGVLKEQQGCLLTRGNLIELWQIWGCSQAVVRHSLAASQLQQWFITHSGCITVSPAIRKSSFSSSSLAKVPSPPLRFCETREVSLCSVSQVPWARSI